jgi:hypothetical protein
VSSRSEPPTQSAPVTVCVQHLPRGQWEVVIAGRRARVVCETLEDARRVAYLSVAGIHDCELIVRDAYNRVLQRELIAGNQGAGVVATASARGAG